MTIIPSETTCDELIISTVSNWGVYGVVAILSHLTKQDLFSDFDPREIADFLFANGCVDGVTRKREPGEDGFPIASGLEIIRQLKELVGIHA
jgi:hypothetical protein